MMLNFYLEISYSYRQILGLRFMISELAHFTSEQNAPINNNIYRISHWESTKFRTIALKIYYYSYLQITLIILPKYVLIFTWNKILIKYRLQAKENISFLNHMIERQKLKCPLYCIFVLATITLIFQLAIMILQPLANVIGFDWNQNNQNIPPNDINEDGLITCSDNQFLMIKIQRGKQIFTGSYAMMIISFIFSIYVFTVLLIATGNFVTTEEEINIKKQNRQRRRIGSLAGLNDQYFTFKLMVTIYIALSIAFATQLVQLGVCSSMRRVYENCEGTKDTQLVALIVLGSIVIGCMTLAWIILLWFRKQFHQFLDSNEKDNEALHLLSNKNQLNRNEEIPIPIPIAPIANQINNSKSFRNRNKNTTFKQNESEEDNDLSSADRFRSDDNPIEKREFKNTNIISRRQILQPIPPRLPQEISEQSSNQKFERENYSKETDTLWKAGSGSMNISARSRRPVPKFLHLNQQKVLQSQQKEPQEEDKLSELILGGFSNKNIPNKRKNESKSPRSSKQLKISSKPTVFKQQKQSQQMRQIKQQKQLQSRRQKKFRKQLQSRKQIQSYKQLKSRKQLQSRKQLPPHKQLESHKWLSQRKSPISQKKQQKKYEELPQRRKERLSSIQVPESTKMSYREYIKQKR